MIFPTKQANKPSKSPKLDFLFWEMNLALLVKSLHLMKSRLGQVYVKRHANWWNDFQTIFGIMFDRWLEEEPRLCKVRGKRKDEQSPASSLTWMTDVNILSYLLVVCSVVSDSATLMDCGPSHSSVHEIFQGGIREWVAISSSRGSSSPRDLNPCFLCLLHWQADSLPLSHLGRCPCLLVDLFKRNERFQL